MIFFHFTCLAHLPSVCKDGLKHGEVPLSPTEIITAVNLTTNPSALAQHWTEGSIYDKRKVRLTIELPDGEAKNWRDAIAGPSQWRKALDAFGQGKFWYYYTGAIKNFAKIEVMHNGEYRELSESQLAILLPAIETERKRIIVSERYVEHGHKEVEFIDDFEKSWLLKSLPPDFEP